MLRSLRKTGEAQDVVVVRRFRCSWVVSGSGPFACAALGVLDHPPSPSA